MKRKKASRRDFCKSALSLAVPMIIPASAWGSNGYVAPSNRVNVGFIGLGNKGFRWTNGSALIKNFINYKKCEIRGLCDVDRRYIQDAKTFVDDAHGHTDCLTFTDFREMLTRDDIDAVVIATPHHWHAVQTILACEHGKDVYVEKPLSNSVQESIAMLDAAQRYDRVVQVGTQARSSRKINFACGMIQQGRIGEIKEVQVGGFGPPVPCNLRAESTPEFMEWDLWVGPAPWRPYNRRIHEGFSGRYLEYGGGVTTDNGHHFFDIAQWALGLDHTGPVEAFLVGEGRRQYPAIKYENGITMSMRTNRGGTGTTFIGTEGQIYIHAWEDVVEYQPAKLRYEYYDYAQNLTQMPQEVQLVNTHLENFLDCVRTRQKTNGDIVAGCNSIILAHLANIVAWAKRPLRWDPEKHEFTNDKAANRYLFRTSRSPWRA